MCLKVFYFCKICKILFLIYTADKLQLNFEIEEKPCTMYCTKRSCSHIKPRLKVKIEDGCEAP